MERRLILVHGIVQGVGFRPFVYNLASRLHLTGFVRNQAGSVAIEVEGEPSTLDCFLSELTTKPPPLAKVKELTWTKQELRGEQDFRIESSQDEAGSPIYVSSDTATCSDCTAELFDPTERRYGYPFLNCTNCGPRLTIITGAPYDRQQTTMADFAMCASCRAEYENPADRRFHAQPIACATCGPRLELRGSAGEPIETADPLGDFAKALCGGAIGAVKGLGGYHLACDARNTSAVGELRRRKHRDEKPFAIMVHDVVAAEACCEFNHLERTLLLSPRRPIVLLRRRPSSVLAAQVAPLNPWLGVMLPYTPLHSLLMRACGAMPLVMTSGNRCDEPIAYENHEALANLRGIADLFLIHNRPIHVRCDDSVTRIVDGQELPLRRSRGYAPEPITLPFECPEPILALGGQLKATFALGRNRQAILSHHLGDLDDFAAYRAYLRDLELYQQLFALGPNWVVHDLHPDYATTRYAQQFGRVGKRLLGVQHHHAHMASCMTEHGLRGPVIGVIFDGTGFGPDDAIWGGEFLVGNYQCFQRAAHLRYVAMPGGEKAIREPWRMAAAHLHDAEVDLPAFAARLSPLQGRTIQHMLERRINSPLTSSAGRLFDAVASLACIRDRVSYEGQAAIELEWLATASVAEGAYPFELCRAVDDSLIVDTRPMIRGVAEDARQATDPTRIARRFHRTLVNLIVAVCCHIREGSRLESVVLSGGVFSNVLLTREATERLGEAGFQVYRHRLVPPNDGGLSLGQLAIAAAIAREPPSQKH